MRRTTLLLLLALAAVACGPSRYALHLEMRHPSRSGIDLGGKIVSVIYSDVGDEGADTFAENMAGAFAKTLEDDYGTGAGSVGVYSVDGTKADYSQKDSLVSMLMETGADMVFLFASPQFQKGSTSGEQPVTVRLYCYDGMDKEDKVKSFSGTAVLNLSDGKIPVSEASDAGIRVAESFVSQWKHEQFSLAYFDSAKWYDALAKAERYDWKGAIDIWFKLLDSGDVIKKACAAYDIAVACYLMGDFGLAEQWLDLSENYNGTSTFTAGLRKRLNSSLQGRK